MHEILTEYPEFLLRQITALTENDRKKLLKKLTKAGHEAFQAMSGQLQQIRQVYYVDPVTELVDSLPKDELAAMAEALVNLTSLKRRFSPDAETVGGPIDVAVISRGDGFVWIKRKHYFPAELNPSYYARKHGGAPRART